MASSRSRGPGSRSTRGPASSRPRSGQREATRPPASTAASGQPRNWGARLRNDRRALWLAAIGATLVLVAVMMGGTLKAWFSQRGEIEALRDQVTAQRVEVLKLQHERARWDDIAYVEQQARQSLKFVRPGEKAYTVLDPEVAAPVIEGMASGVTSDHVPWYGTLWSSLRAADVPAGSPR